MKALFGLLLGILSTAGLTFAGTPHENEAIQNIAKRIEDRRTNDGAHSIYSGVYLIWAWGTADEVREAISAGADPNSWEPQTPAWDNPLHRKTMPALAIASLNNPDPEVVKILLAGGADPNIANSAGATPLHMAAATANSEKLRLLMEAGARIDAVDEDGFTAFHHLLASAERWETERIKGTLAILLDAGLDPNAATPNGATPLHLFAERAWIDDAATAAKLLPALRLFIERGADVHRETEGGYEPIWGLSRRSIGYDRVASAKLPPYLVRLLIDLGYDINAQNKNGSTIMMYCAGYFTQPTVLKRELLHDFSVLLDAGADPDIRDNQEKSAFDRLHPNARRVLLESPLGKRMGTPFQGFFALCADGALAEVAKALDEGAAIDAGDPNYLDTPPLSLAAFRNSEPKVVALLLERGAKPNQTNLHGMTPLHFAAVADNKQAARLLLEAGADPNALDRHGGYAPLHYAMREAVPEKAAELAALVKLLTEAGADPNAANLRGERPLHEFMETATLADEAAFEAFLPPLQDFVAAGADPDAEDMNGRSPLFKVFANFDKRLPAWTVKFIVGLGGDINKQDSRGQTALAITAEKFRSLSELTGYARTCPEMIEDLDFLLDLGADPGLRDSSGRQAYAYFVPQEKFPADHPLLARLKVRASYKGKFGSFAQSTADEVREALAAGFDPNGLDYRHVPYLTDAVINPAPEALAAFLNAGADPNRSDKDGKTPLMAAAGMPKSAAVAALLRYGAKVDARDNIGMGALHFLFQALLSITDANQDEFTASLRLLLDAGADTNAKSNYGHTPYGIFLYYASQREATPDLSLVVPLLREAADKGGLELYGENDGGLSPPLQALVQKKVPWHVVDMYLDLGWDINERTEFGETPLIAAVLERYGHLYHDGDESKKLSREEFVKSGHVDEIVDFFMKMIERGADPDIAAKWGTAFDALSPFLQEYLLKTPIGERLRRTEK